MFMKKWLTRLSVFLVMMMIVSTLGSLGVFAESNLDEAKTLVTEKTLEIELNDDFFNPKEILITSGTTTTLILKNKGKKKHTFTVEKLGVDAEVQPGNEKTITIEPKQSGTYDLICRYHFQEGMVGKVIVN